MWQSQLNFPIAVVEIKLAKFHDIHYEVIPRKQPSEESQREREERENGRRKGEKKRIEKRREKKEREERKGEKGGEIEFFSYVVCKHLIIFHTGFRCL